MMTKIESEVHLDHILFGDILGVSNNDLLLTGFITISSALYFLIKGKDLIVYVFDRHHAKKLSVSLLKHFTTAFYLYYQ